MYDFDPSLTTCRLFSQYSAYDDAPGYTLGYLVANPECKSTCAPPGACVPGNNDGAGTCECSYSRQCNVAFTGPYYITTVAVSYEACLATCDNSYYCAYFNFVPSTGACQLVDTYQGQEDSAGTFAASNDDPFGCHANCVPANVCETGYMAGGGTCGCEYYQNCGVLYNGPYIVDTITATPAECRALCDVNSACRYYSFDTVDLTCQLTDDYYGNYFDVEGASGGKNLNSGCNDNCGVRRLFRS